jgi:hypothetical protein
VCRLAIDESRRLPNECVYAPDLLTALKACLDEHAIAAVKVAVDGQAYAMEGTASRGSSPLGQE